MFICLDCNNMFEEPSTVDGDLNEYFGFKCREKLSICPFCQSNNFVETKRCDSCGEYITTDKYYRIGSSLYCENCCEQYKLEDGVYK